MKAAGFCLVLREVMAMVRTSHLQPLRSLTAMLHHHCSPPVRFQVVPGRALQRVAVLLLILGAMILLYWAYASAQPGWLRAALALVWGCLAWLLWRWLRAPMSGVLHWQWGQWHWLPTGASRMQVLQSPYVVLDVQMALGVLWQLPQQRRYCFLWLQCQGDLAHWDDVRRAVYSSVSLPQQGPNN